MSETAAPTSGTPNQLVEPHEVAHAGNASVVRLGPLAELSRYTFERGGMRLPGKIWLHDLLGLSGCEISFGAMPPFASIPFHHRHKKNEEVYLFLSGEGQIRVDERIIDVREGDAVRVSPAGVRSWRNTSAVPLVYVVIQAREGSLEGWTGTDGEGVPGAVTWPA